MKFTLSLIPGTRIAFYHWAGPITLEDRERNRKEILEFCQKAGVRSLLIDGRDQVFNRVDNVEISKIFSFAEELPQVMRGFRMAIVHRHDDDILPVAATFAAKGALTIKSFLNIYEAREWLEAMEEPPNKTDAGDA